MQNDHNFTAEPDHRILPAVAAVLAVLLSLALPVSAVADALSADYEAPNFDAPMFERDAVSLQAGERGKVVSALTAVAQNLPSAPYIDTDVKEKALAIALRLSPLDAEARSAHQRLLPSFTGSSDGASLSSAIEFANGAEVFAALAPKAKDLWQQRAQPDDEILAPLLMEIALTILSPAEWEAQEVQIAAHLYREMSTVTDPAAQWAEVVQLQPIAGDGASLLASRLRALPSTPITVEAPEPVLSTVPAPKPAPAPTPTPAPASLSTPGPATATPSVPSTPASTTSSLAIKSNAAVVPFVFADVEHGGAAGGTVRLKITPFDETEKSLYGLFGDSNAPPEMRLTVADKGSRSVEVTGFAAAENWARKSFAAWPTSMTGRVSLRREREKSSADGGAGRQNDRGEDDPGDSVEPRNVSLPLALLLHSTFTGQSIDPAFALSGQLAEDGTLTAAADLPMADVLKKFGSYGDQLSLAVVPSSASSDESLRDALVLGEIDLFIEPQIVTVQNMDDLLSVAIAENRSKKLLDAMALFAEIEQLDNLVGNLGNSFVREKLQEVLELWPTHLSAQMLLLAGDADKRPALLSRNGSVRAVDSALSPLRNTYEADLGFGTEFFDVNELVAEARNRLQSVDGKLSPEARNYRLAAEDLVVLFRDYLSLKNRDAGNANAEQHRRNLADRLRSLELLTPKAG